MENNDDLNQKHMNTIQKEIELRDLKLKAQEQIVKTKDEMIENLQNSIKLKEDQIQTLKDSLKLKSEQVNTLDNSVKIKDEKINTLEKSIELIERQLENLSDTSIDKNILLERDKIIQDLEEKIEALSKELATADEDLEAMEQENEKLRNQFAAASGAKIIDWTEIQIPKSRILEKMKEILMKALHNVTIAVPNIKDLQKLLLYELKSSVNMKISCLIDPSLEEDAELLEEFESLDNISIRMYEGEDRYILDRDGEELLFAVIGKNENNHLVIHTKDPKHLRTFRALIMESWLRSRKIE
ncbi:MAG: coiled-coil domain-containing protein [Candidatus Thorarchaeota archaeon]